MTKTKIKKAATALSSTMEKFIGNEGVRFITEAFECGTLDYNADYPEGYWTGPNGEEKISILNGNGKVCVDYTFCIAKHQEGENGETLRYVTLLFWGQDTWKGEDAVVAAYFVKKGHRILEANYERGKVKAYGNATRVRKLLSHSRATKPHKNLEEALAAA